MRTASAPAALLGCLLLCTTTIGTATAQSPQPAGQQPITQQEQNRLRADAFAAEKQGRFSAAADAFLALTKAEPDRPDWAVAAGRCLGRSGRFGDAIDLLDAARKRFPDHVELRAMLARTLLLRTEREAGMLYPEILWADAAELAEGVLAIEPNHEDCRLLLAQARYLLGDWQQAVAQARQAVQRHPERPGAHLLLGRIAHDRFRSLLSRFRTERPTGQARADLVAEIDEQRKIARSSYERAAELGPTRARPHVALSQLASLDGEQDLERQHLLDALAIDPDTVVDHEGLTDGMSWQQRRDLYRDLRKRYVSTTKNPDTARARAKAATLLFYEGRANHDGGDWQAARTCMQRALEHNPDATNAHYYWFLSAYSLGQLEEAEEQAAAFARSSAPAFADTLRALPSEQRAKVGAIVQFLGDRAFGQNRIANSRDLNHVIACLKDSADAWNNHAFLCRETGSFDEALASYQHALEKEPDSPQLWNDAGVILQYHLPGPENLRKARQMYEQALALAAKVLADPDSSEKARKFARDARENAQANLAELGQ